MDSVILSSAPIIVISMVAMFLFVVPRIISDKTISAIVSVSGLVMVAAAVTYALLLGAGIDEVLIYILMYTVLGMLYFLPTRGDKCQNIDNNKVNVHSSTAERDKEKQKSEVDGEL